ncbi:MAG: cytochrome b, partial [Pseudomonadota bacterium]|nr:cytochrome b [Pseudomonadota bacterium]
VAVAVTGLFVLGLWMVGLGYYDPWYQRAPDIHKSAGVLLFGVMLARFAWRYANPCPEASGSAMEKKLAAWVHRLLYVLLYVLMLSGYLISTADGRGINVFGLFSVAASISGLENQADIAGKVHELLAFALIALAILHTMAALKHHFVDRDQTLKRMLSIRH